MTLNPVASLMLSKARSYLGEMESPAYSNYHPSVTWYNANIANLGSHWNYCAAGVTREFHNAGLKSLLKGRAYVPYMMQDFLDGYGGGKLLWVDGSLSAARAGDVVFFDWSKPSDGKHSVWTGNHVGVIESVRSSTEAVTIEHNTSVPGTGNEGTTRKVRDVRYIVAVGRPNWGGISGSGGGSAENPYYIPGTTLPLLDIDGDLGPRTIKALGTVLKARGHALTPSTVVTTALVKAVQAELNKGGIKDREGKTLVVDGKGFGSNSNGRYPATGWTRTISACQIGHGVSSANADGYFDKGESSEVKRIQRDVNSGGVKDSPFFNG